MSIRRKNDHKMFWLTLANHYDSILQAYRIIFISSETILISFAALLISFPTSLLKLVLIFSLFLLGFCLVGPWIKITWDRGLYVSYCNMQLQRVEEGEIPKEAYAAFRQWKEEPDWQRKQKKIDEYRKQHNQQPILKEYARLIMGLILPISFLVLWVVILFVHILVFIL